MEEAVPESELKSEYKLSKWERRGILSQKKKIKGIDKSERRELNARIYLFNVEAAWWVPLGDGTALLE